MIRKSTVLRGWLIFLAAGGGYYALIRLTGFVLPCFWRELTGVPCPLCGATAMFLALARLDFAAAFRANPVLLLLLVLWAGVSAAALIGRSGLFRRKRLLLALAAASLAALILYGFLRVCT